MREFFGLIFFVILLSIWSWVFAISEETETALTPSANTSVAKVMQSHVNDVGETVNDLLLPAH